MRKMTIATLSLLFMSGTALAQSSAPIPDPPRTSPSTMAPSPYSVPSHAYSSPSSTNPSTKVESALGGGAPRGISSNTGTGQYSTESEANSQCGSQPVVWMNTKSHVYFNRGTKNYGATKKGSYMCQSDANKLGHAAKNKVKKASKMKPSQMKESPMKSY